MSAADQTRTTREVVQNFYSWALGGQFEAAIALLHPELTVYEPSFLSYGGITKTPQGFVGLFAQVASLISVPSIHLNTLVVEGDIAVAFLSAQTVNGKQDLSIAEQSTLRDGKIVEMRIFYHEGGDLFPRAPRG